MSKTLIRARFQRSAFAAVSLIVVTGALTASVASAAPSAITTSNPLVWTSGTGGSNSDWAGLAFGSVGSPAVERFVSVSTNRAIPMYSDDGKAWSGGTSAKAPNGTNLAARQWRNVTYGTPGDTGRFVSVSLTGSSYRSMWSDDGKVWTATSTDVSNCPWHNVAYGTPSSNPLYVAIPNGACTSGGSDGSGRLITSSDGKTWTFRDAPNGKNYTGITYANGTFVAVSNEYGAASGNQLAMTSTDGINWAARSTPNYLGGFQSVAYGYGRFVAVGLGGAVMTSSDNGVTWTGQTAAAYNDWINVNYVGGSGGIGGTFVAVAAGTSVSNHVMYSYDGVTWTAQASTVDADFYGLAFGKGLVVAVANGGTTDAITMWTQLASSSAATLDTGSTAVPACKTSACYIKSSGEGVSGNAGTLTATARQWQRCTILDDNSSCSNIAGRTGAWYNAMDADIGYQVRVKTAMTTTLGGILEAWSALTGLITPHSVVAPTIDQGLTSGAPKKGTRVHSSFGTWQGYIAGVSTLAFQWQRCTGVGTETCSNIGGATTQWYTPVKAGLGKRLRVTATITTRTQTATGSSAITGVTS